MGYDLSFLQGVKVKTVKRQGYNKETNKEAKS